MKICRFAYKNSIYFGRLTNESVEPLENYQLKTIKQTLPISKVKILPPVIPSKIVCVGRNYREHAEELGNEVPKEPLLFLKAPSAIITNENPIILPKQSSRVEHEAELAIIISKKCKSISPEENPLNYVLGYTCLNDVTARDLQKKDIQFTRAKSFDTFCPIGHFIETSLDPNNLKIEARVNGKIKQKAHTSQMIFPVEFLIRYISNYMTLMPFDIIATGTPAGVSPLNPGDICEIEIENIGILKNPVKREDEL
ncbi:MAG: fumarylacetoacetate hydrolase family protein [Pyrinomonadaceae bacterium]|nr:fumarylacetoacetate hydrolase family protein [Pyrinomonadaceae bacterium]MCX7640982.1 fumarylacetoacetate hydrolase family protein [Pyrinomonadaceae bacterium]MDW8305094.1 fumarylacetoacetate hydrolase family protein [Acidobacteriota bacterium]